MIIKRSNKKQLASQVWKIWRYAATKYLCYISPNGGNSKTRLSR